MDQTPTRRPASLLLRFVKYWLPVGMMLGLMYYFSTDVFSGQNTRSVVEMILGWLSPNASPVTISRVNHLVRKGGHFFEYAVLAMLVFRAFRADSPLRWRFSWSFYTLVFVVSWSLLDEYHQTLTTRRGGSISDSILDSCGGVFGLILISVGGLGWRRLAPNDRGNASLKRS